MKNANVSRSMILALTKRATAPSSSIFSERGTGALSPQDLSDLFPPVPLFEDMPLNTEKGFENE